MWKPKYQTLLLFLLLAILLSVVGAQTSAENPLSYAAFPGFVVAIFLGFALPMPDNFFTDLIFDTIYWGVNVGSWLLLLYGGRAAVLHLRK